MSDDSRTIAVVGAGPAGLTAAYELQRAGHRAVVYDANPWIGGRTRTDPVDGYRIDAGAQLIGSIYTRVLTLVDELGLGARLVRSPGRDALWRGGRAHEVVYGSVSGMLGSGAIPLGTKLRLGATYLPFLTRHGEDLDLHEPERAAGAGLDSESIASWGAREMGRDFVDYLVYPQLTGYYGALPEETSAALYHLLARHGMDVAVHAFRDGASTLAEALARTLRSGGGEVHLESPVAAIERVGDRLRLSTAEGAREFDAVVVATPGPEARRLLSDAAPELSSWLAAVRVRPALTVGLLLERPAGVRYFGLSFPRDESSTVAAVCVQENKGAETIPEGRGALVALIRPDVAERLVDADAKAIVDAVLPDLVRAFPGIDAHVRRARVYRWPAGNPLVYPRYLAHLAALRGGVERPGPVVLAGDYLYTPSVEGAVTSGARAARRLAEYLRTP